MRASLGLGMMAIAAAFAAAPVLAQSASQPPVSGETVGPRELRDFSLPGTTTTQPQRPQAEQPATPPAAQPSTPAPQRQPAERPRTPPPQERESPAPAPEAPAADSVPVLQSQPLPEPTADPLPDEPFISQPLPAPSLPPPSASVPVEQDSWTMLPWLLAALLAGGAAAYFLYRKRGRAALANAEALDAFVPVEPQPTRPEPTPAPLRHTAVPAATPMGGIVSTALRPWIDIECTPQRCVIDDRQATIDFAIVVRNGGTAPARDVRVEVAMINAGPAQDQEIRRFFDQPAGVGESLEVIPPMRSLQLTSRVSLPLDQVRALEMGGRRLFVPLLAFNALYRSTSAACQTSTTYLVGREGDGEKLAPFRLDLGPRIFRNLGVRPHHMQVRR